MQRIAFDAVAKLLETDAGALGLQSFIQDIVNQRGLAGARDAGDGDHGAQRKHDVDIAQIVSVRAEDAQKTARRLMAQGGHGNTQFAIEVARGEGFGGLQQILARAAEEQLAARFAGARSQIEHVIGGGDGFGVMLDDEDGVAEIAKAFRECR